MLLYFPNFGFRLSLVGRNTSALETVKTECVAAGAKDVLTLSCDLSEESKCQQAVASTVQHYSRLDVFVHCAGILINGGVETLSVADYDKIMNINTR